MGVKGDAREYRGIRERTGIHGGYVVIRESTGGYVGQQGDTWE